MGKGLVSEHPVVVNVLAGHTHCRTLQKQTFILRSYCFDGDKARKRSF